MILLLYSNYFIVLSFYISFKSSEASISYHLFLARSASDITDMAKQLDDLHRANADKQVSVGVLEENFSKAREALLTSQKDSSVLPVLVAPIAVDGLEENLSKAKEALLAFQQDLLHTTALAMTLAINFRARRDQYLQDASVEGRAKYLASYSSVHNYSASI